MMNDLMRNLVIAASVALLLGVGIVIGQQLPDSPAALPPKPIDDFYNVRFAEIRDMQPGQGGWAVPWALSIDANGTHSLRGNYVVHGTRGGTVQLWVERTDEGWNVNTRMATTYDYEYPGDYVSKSPRDLGDIPVGSVRR